MKTTTKKPKLGIVTNTDKYNMETNASVSKAVWAELEREFRRTQKMLDWMINGQFQTGISPMKCYGLTAERIEEIYNVNFGN